MMKATAIVALLLILAVSGFAPPSPARATTKNLLRSSPNNNEDFPPPPEDDNATVDWDAEWKKVVANKEQPDKRPGQDFYKSDAEISVTKTVNQGIEKAQKEAAKLDIPSVNMAGLTSDWRFWIGIIAVISVGTALLSAPLMPEYESYSI